ncbi:MAG: hypothetical protein ACJ79E_12260 [Anaeromyxobacteraceae bacterium]
MNPRGEVARPHALQLLERAHRLMLAPERPQQHGAAEEEVGICLAGEGALVGGDRFLLVSARLEHGAAQPLLACVGPAQRPRLVEQGLGAGEVGRPLEEQLGQVEARVDERRVGADGALEVLPRGGVVPSDSRRAGGGELDGDIDRCRRGRGRRLRRRGDGRRRRAARGERREGDGAPRRSA